MVLSFVVYHLYSVTQFHIYKIALDYKNMLHIFLYVFRISISFHKLLGKFHKFFINFSSDKFHKFIFLGVMWLLF